MIRVTRLSRGTKLMGMRQGVRFAAAKAEDGKLKGLKLPQNHNESSWFMAAAMSLGMLGGALVWELKRVLFGDEATLPFDVLTLRRDIEDVFENEPHLLRQALTLHWNSNCGFDYSTSSGGSTGLLDYTKPENQNIKEIVTALEEVRVSGGHDISTSDLWIFAASIALQDIEGPDVEYRYGRKDRDTPTTHEIPDLSKLATTDEIRFLFYRLGLNDQEIVSYIGGSIHPKDRKLVFSNEFLKHVVSEDSKAFPNTPVVAALRSDKMFMYWCKRYANDLLQFRDDYATSFSLLTHTNFGSWGPIHY